MVFPTVRQGSLEFNTTLNSVSVTPYQTKSLVYETDISMREGWLNELGSWIS